MIRWQQRLLVALVLSLMVGSTMATPTLAGPLTSGADVLGTRQSKADAEARKAEAAREKYERKCRARGDCVPQIAISFRYDESFERCWVDVNISLLTPGATYTYDAIVRTGDSTQYRDEGLPLGFSDAGTAGFTLDRSMIQGYGWTAEITIYGATGVQVAFASKLVACSP